MLAGMRGYALQQCLQEQRKQREAAGGDQENPPDKYEQPGELVTLPSGKAKGCPTHNSCPRALPGCCCLFA
jgi:hypothetical protein